MAETSLVVDEPRLALESRAPIVTPDQKELVRRTIAKDATPEELGLFFYDCARQGVHPLDKLLHFTKRAGKYTPVTSIDLMRMRAAESGEYAGNDPYDFAGTPGQKGFTASARVWRLVQGQRVSFTRSARWEEYCPPAGQDHMWKRMPHVMLGKCAEAQALRVGFPRQLHGLYAVEELSADEEAPARPAPRPAASPAVINREQQKLFFARADELGVTREALKAWLEGRSITSTTAIRRDQFDELLEALVTAAPGLTAGDPLEQP